MIAFLPFTDIYVDYFWNVRLPGSVRQNESDAVRDSETGIPQGEGLRGLARSIARRGQDAPVQVRAVVRGVTLGGWPTRCPFELIAGFRRYTAIKSLDAVPGVPLGHIKAERVELDDLGARLLNCRENTERQNLSSEEQVRAVATLVAAGLTQERIASELSISASYVGKLAMVARLPFAVRDHWNGQVTLPGREKRIDRKLSLGDLVGLQTQAVRESLLPHQILERYTLMLEPDTRPQHTHKGSGVRLKRVHDAATLAGKLVRAGVLDVGSLDWSAVVGSSYDGFPIDIGPDSYETRHRFFDVAEKAFEAAREGREVTRVEPTEDP